MQRVGGEMQPRIDIHGLPCPNDKDVPPDGGCGQDAHHIRETSTSTNVCLRRPCQHPGLKMTLCHPPLRAFQVGEPTLSKLCDALGYASETTTLTTVFREFSHLCSAQSIDRALRWSGHR
jgi:hypothetical protein